MIRTFCVGNLVEDPDLKYVGQNNIALVSTRIACPARGKTVFMNIEFWGKHAEVIAQYGHKGSCISADCQLKEEVWETEGRKNYKFVLACDAFDFVGGKSKEEKEEEEKQDD